MLDSFVLLLFIFIFIIFFNCNVSSKNVFGLFLQKNQTVCTLSLFRQTDYF